MGTEWSNNGSESNKTFTSALWEQDIYIYI